MKKRFVFIFFLIILLVLIVFFIFFFKSKVPKNIKKVTSAEAVNIAKKELVKRKFDISKKYITVSEYIPDISMDRQTKDNWVIFFSDDKDASVEVGLVWVIVDRYDGSTVDVVEL